MSDKTIAYTHHAANGMAGLLGVGALYGAIVKGSRMSLVAGGLLASAYAASGWYARQGEYLLSNQLATLSGGALALGMGMRYLGTRGAVPLALSTLGVASATYHGYNWRAIEPISVTAAKVQEKKDQAKNVASNLSDKAEKAQNVAIEKKDQIKDQVKDGVKNVKDQAKDVKEQVKDQVKDVQKKL